MISLLRSAVMICGLLALLLGCSEKHEDSETRAKPRAEGTAEERPERETENETSVDSAAARLEGMADTLLSEAVNEEESGMAAEEIARDSLHTLSIPDSQQAIREATLADTMRDLAEATISAERLRDTIDALPDRPTPTESRTHRPLLAEKLGIRYVVLDPESVSAQIVGISPADPKGVTIVSAFRKLAAKCVVGSGFVESFSPVTPRGLLMLNGRIINPFDSMWFEGIVAADREGRLLLDRWERVRRTSAHSAFQSGPVLVWKGKPMVRRNRDEKVMVATRGFIGLRRNGQIVAGVTERRIELEELAMALALPQDEDGLGCWQAINLAGGGSEGLMIHSDSLQLYGNVGTIQASVIAFTRRQ